MDTSIFHRKSVDFLKRSLTLIYKWKILANNIEYILDSLHRYVPHALSMVSRGSRHHHSLPQWVLGFKLCLKKKTLLILISWVFVFLMIFFAELSPVWSLIAISALQWAISVAVREVILPSNISPVPPQAASNLCCNLGGHALNATWDDTKERRFINKYCFLTLSCSLLCRE